MSRKTKEEKDSDLIQAIIEGLNHEGIQAFKGQVSCNILAPLPKGYHVTLVEIKDRRVHFPSGYHHQGTLVVPWSGIAKTYSEKRVQLIVATAKTRYERLLQAYQA